MTDDDFDESLTKFVDDAGKLWQSRQGDLPRELFHYTSGHAFKGIVESGKLWATLSTELNDLTELRHAADRLRATLVRHRDLAKLPELQVLYPPQVTQFAYERSDMSSVFVASLSAAKDDLPQWSMYAARFEGVAIGFDPSALVALDAANDTAQAIGFCKVSYDEEISDAFWEWFVARWEREAAVAVTRHIHRAADPLMHIASWFGNLAMASLTILPRMKSPYFASEKEWRLVHLHFPEHVDCEVVSGGNARTHVALDLTQLAGRLPITSVWLGPAVANDPSEERVAKLLATCGLGDVAVRRSQIPLRGEAREIEL